MSKSKFEVNMLEGSIFKNIVLFAVPLILSSILQLFLQCGRCYRCQPLDRQ